MEYLLFLIICLFVICFVFYFGEMESKMKKLEKRCNRLRFEIKKLQDNEFYIFDYINGMYEDMERGTYEKRKESK